MVLIHHNKRVPMTRIVVTLSHATYIDLILRKVHHSNSGFNDEIPDMGHLLYFHLKHLCTNISVAGWICRICRILYIHVLPICSYHDDVINWKHFHVTGHLCREFTGPRWIPRTKASDEELWCFLWSAPEYTAELTIVRLVIWDAIEFIMTSLQCIQVPFNKK